MFSSYISNGEEFAKRDHGNKFRGSKNGGREVWVGLEWPENRKIRRPTVAAATALVGSIWASPKMVRRETWLGRSSGGGAPPWPTRVARGMAGDASHGKNLFGLEMDRNNPIGCSRSWGVFSRVLELKICVLGLGFYLARKTRFI